MSTNKIFMPTRIMCYRVPQSTTPGKNNPRVYSVPGLSKDNLKIEVEKLLKGIANKPGLSKDNLKIEVEKLLKGIANKRHQILKKKLGEKHTLPVNADLEKITAHLEDGVLKITVPTVDQDENGSTKVIDIKAI